MTDTPPDPGGNPPPSPIPQAPYPPYGLVPALPPQASGLSIASMIVGIASIPIYPVGFVLGIASVVMGLIARKQIREKPSEIGGDSLALAGIICGAIGTVVSVTVLYLVYVIFTNVVPKLDSIGEAASRAEAKSDLVDLFHAVGNYQVANSGAFPEDIHELRPFLREPASLRADFFDIGESREYLYVGKAAAASGEPDSVIIVAPQSIDGQRSVLLKNGSVILMNESEYQRRGP